MNATDTAILKLAGTVAELQNRVIQLEQQLAEAQKNQASIVKAIRNTRETVTKDSKRTRNLAGYAYMIGR